jgi:hypothetical protein
LREEHDEKGFASMCVNSESVSNEIDERDWKYENRSEQKI